MDDIAGLTPTDGNFIVGNGSNFVLESGATARTSLGLAIGSDVQAYDADLAAIAGLTSAADKGIQFTGSGTAATFDLTAAGKALLDDADAAAQRTTLGLAIGSNVQAHDAQLDAIAGLTPTDGNFIVGNGSNFVLESGATARTSLGLAIGTDVQAYDDDLAAIAGLTSAADKGIQFTGSGTAATFDLTAAGKALLDDADAAAQRTTLGLNNVENTALSTGNAGTATALQTSRNIGGASFDGSAGISIQLETQSSGAAPTTTPSSGTMIFDTTTNKIYIYNSSNGDGSNGADWRVFDTTQAT